MLLCWIKSWPVVLANCLHVIIFFSFYYYKAKHHNLQMEYLQQMLKCTDFSIVLTITYVLITAIDIFWLQQIFMGYHNT